jgi:hypothetical protein
MIQRQAVYVRDGMTLAALRLFRRKSPEEQGALLECARNMTEGMSAQEAGEAAYRALGFSPKEARTIVAEALARPVRWQDVLD